MIAKRYSLNKKISSSGLVQQMVYYSVAVFVPAIFSILSSSIFTRMFSTDSYGFYTLAITLASFIASLFSQWLQQPITRYLPGLSNLERLSFVRIIKVCLIFICGSVLCFGALGEWHYGRSGVVAPYVLPEVIFICLQVLFTVIGAVLQADLEARTYAYFQVLYGSLSFTLSVTFMFWIAKSPVFVVWASDAALFVVIPLLYCKAKSFRYAPSDEESDQQKDTFRKIASYGFPMMGYLIATNILGVSDRFILGVFKGPTEVGIYTANYSLVAGAVGLFSAPVITAAHPFLMKAWASKDETQTSKWLGIIASNVLTLGIVAIGGTWLLAPTFARVFLGVPFRSGSGIMPIIVAGSVAMSFAIYAHKPFEFKERTSLMMVLAFVAALSNLALNILLVPHFGYVAAAWTTFACYALYAILTVIMGQRHLKWHISWDQVLTVVLSVIIGLVVGELTLRGFSNVSTWLGVCCSLVMYVFISLLPLMIIHRKNIRGLLLKKAT